MSCGDLDEQGVRRLFSDAGRNAHTAALVLRDLIGNPERSDLAEALRAREHDGDRLTHDAIHGLARLRSRLTTIDAGDAYRLAGAIDDIVDDTDEAGDMLVLYRIEAPMEQAVRLADVLVLATSQVADALAAFAVDREITEELDLEFRDSRGLSAWS